MIFRGGQPDLVVNYVIVNLGESFEQTLNSQHPSANYLLDVYYIACHFLFSLIVSYDISGVLVKRLTRNFI